MPKFETIKDGDTLYDITKDRWHGWTYWIVRVITVHPESRSALVSWNMNAPKEMGEHSLAKLQRKPRAKK
jgi:hypothetical protein